MTVETDGEGSADLPARVLLVEDNVIVAMNAEELLLEIGASNVFVAMSLAEAEAFCDAEEFDFALLDINLGDGTSIGIAERLSQANIPFAFASGQDDYALLPAALRSSPVLRKPYLLSDLERIVRAAGRGATSAG